MDLHIIVPERQILPEIDTLRRNFAALAKRVYMEEQRHDHELKLIEHSGHGVFQNDGEDRSTLSILSANRPLNDVNHSPGGSPNVLSIYLRHGHPVKACYNSNAFGLVSAQFTLPRHGDLERSTYIPPESDRDHYEHVHKPAMGEFTLGQFLTGMISCRQFPKL